MAASALTDLSKSANPPHDKSSSRKDTANEDDASTSPLLGMVNSGPQTNNLRSEVRKLRETLTRCSIDTESFKEIYYKVKLFTSLPSFCVMMTVFNFIAPFLSLNMKLSPFNQFLVTILPLRLNLSVQYLAYRFDVSVATISRVYNN